MSGEAGVAGRLAEVRERIAAAARRAGRDPSRVTLIGVSKRQPAARVVAALRAGLEQVGESYVQEARDKIPEVLAALPAGTPRPRFRLVGRLQRNKAGEAARLFDAVDSLDGERLARALDRRAGERGRALDVLVQVNLSREPQKGGAPPEELPALLKACAGLSHLRVVGLMTVPEASADPEDARPAFAALRALRDELRPTPEGAALRELSMGMSADFEVAIEEGATLVRVGTALFGPRQPRA